MIAQEIFESNKEKYFKLISVFQKENSKINLSSFNDYENILNKHILDSLNIFGFKNWEEFYINKEIHTVADIGTGGGFPGLALAIVLPQINFTLIDSIKKKCLAIESMIKELELENVRVINDRVENTKDKYDFTVSRAVAEFNKIFEWSKNITNSNGKIYLYKSPKEEINGFSDKIEYNIGEDKRVIYEFQLTSN